jgi:hypothetical protein
VSDQEIIRWLLEGNISIRYQVYRDLLSPGTEHPDSVIQDESYTGGQEGRPAGKPENLPPVKLEEIKNRIGSEGWGKKYLSLQRENGHWGRGFYQPKWTSSHYTLLDLRNLYIPVDCPPVQRCLGLILQNHKAPDGGIDPSVTRGKSDVCINGMGLNYGCYFRCPEEDLVSIVDFLLSEQMADGGFNCRSNHGGARHSSLHTTLSVCEGILEYRRNNYTYRLEELNRAEEESVEFILQHRLYRSDRTGEIIDKNFLRLAYPSRWRYDILRALDYFRDAGREYDERMSDALGVLMQKRSRDGTWKLQAHHPGARHFDMETVGKASRWNTLRARRVLRHFNIST